MTIPTKQSKQSSTVPKTESRTSRRQPDMVDTLVTWVFRVISFPLWIVTTIVGQMLTPGAAGASFLGKLVFLFLVVLSSDSYWQMLFEGNALFGWYEETWTGWGWLPSLNFFPLRFSLGLFANPLNWICLGVGFIIQSFLSACFNGERFAHQNARVIGLIAVATWVFDIIMTFTSRYPLRYTEPSDVIGCILFNIFTIGCAEWGRWGEKVLSGK